LTSQTSRRSVLVMLGQPKLPRRPTPAPDRLWQHLPAILRYRRGGWVSTQSREHELRSQMNFQRDSNRVGLRTPKKGLPPEDPYGFGFMGFPGDEPLTREWSASSPRLRALGPTVCVRHAVQGAERSVQSPLAGIAPRADNRITQRWERTLKGNKAHGRTGHTMLATA
jgi:hypothetical protein